MSEWWTYRPSDFLLFAPRTYYRLVELYNAELWPLPLVAFVLSVLLAALAWRTGPAVARAVMAALAVAWAFVAWRFLWLHYASINWAAPWFALLFAVQAIALSAAAALGRRIAEAGVERARRHAGLLLLALALALQPLIALASGRPLAQLEIPGLAPDPTAVVTLGLLLIVGAPRLLLAIPVLWCVGAALTLSNMRAPDAAVPALAAVIAVIVVAMRRPALRD